MKLLRSLAQAAFLIAAALSANAQSTNTNNPAILGQWDFNTASNLGTATIGTPLTFQNVTPQYASFTINGQNAGVVSFPASNPAQKILATYAPTNNGGGTNLNQYTLIMDLMYPSASEGFWNSIFNTDTNNTTDGELFLDPEGRVGVFNNWIGFLSPNTWYRLVVTYDLATNQWTRYINGSNFAGTNAGPSTFPLPEGRVDGPFSLPGGLLFFSDNDGEVAPLYVNVIQLRAGVMSDADVLALGGPGSANLGTGGEPAGDVTISSIARNGNQVVITVDNGGRTVQLQQAPTLPTTGAPQWTNVGTPQTSPTFTVPLSGNMAFFRVQVL